MKKIDTSESDGKLCGPTQMAPQGLRAFTDLIDLAPFGICVVDSQLSIAHVNAAAEKDAFGRIRPVIGRDLAEVMHLLWPDRSAEEILSHFRSTLRTGEPFRWPRLIDPRGEAKSFEPCGWELHRLILPDGRYGVICYSGSGRADIGNRSGEAGTGNASREQSEREIERLASFPILDSNPVIELDTDGTVLFVNPSANKLFPGIETAGAGHPFIGNWNNLKARLDSRNPVHREIMVNEHWYHQTIHYLEWVQRVRIYGLEITKSKQAQRELEDSEHRYRQLVQTSPDAIIVHRQGRILYANAAAVGLYLADCLSQLKEKNILDLVHPDDRDSNVKRMRQLEKGQKLPFWEMKVLRLDGQELLVEAYASRITYGDHRAIQVIIRDITMRKRAEMLKQAVADVDEVIHSKLTSKEVMNTALSKARGAMGCETAAISLREGNRWRLSYVLGYPEGSIGSYMSDEDEPHGVLAVKYRKAVAVDDAFNDPRVNCEHMKKWNVRSVLVVPLIVKDDPIGVLFMNYHSRSVTFSPADIDFAERFSGSLSFALENARLFEDLVESRDELERRVAERTTELAMRAEQLRALAGELTMAEQRERRRLANVLHDHLQQLLVGAKFGLTALGKAGDETQKQTLKEVSEVIDEAIASSRSLTAELSPPILHDEGLRAGLEWLARRLQRMHGFALELEAEQIGVLPDDLTILLFQAVRELLLNAVKHSQSHSARVTARRIGESLEMTVVDYGIGFDSESLPPPGESGRGFGLFSIRERLELFGGSMNIESTPGQGSRIRLTVPVTVSINVGMRSSDATVVAERVARKRAPLPVAGRKIRLLLADDHAVVRQGIATLLAEEPDMEIVGAAANGREAVDLASKLQPEVILMDMNMPILNGVETTRLIHRSFPEIRIIGLSMFEEAEKAQAMRDAGAATYLTKSGPADELISGIRAVIGRFPGTEPS